MEEIKFSVVGFGYMGKLHTIALKSLPLCYDHLPFRIIFDKLLTTRELDPWETGYRVHTTSIADLYGTDVVDICTPNFLHREQIEKAIAGGILNIYCEKPLTGVYDEERQLVDLATEKKVNNQMGLVLRFLPAVTRARRMIADGLLGEIIHFNCHMYHQSYLNPDRPMSWRLQKEKSGGGALVDLGIHMIDLVHYLLGPIKEVKGHTKTVIAERPSVRGVMPVDVDDFAHLDLMLDNGVSGTMEVSRMAAGKGEDTAIEIFGTEGSLKIDTKNPEWPEIALWRENTRKQGEFIKYQEVEEDLKILWPSGKFSLGWMVNSHMASLLSFLLKIQGHDFRYVQLPVFDNAAQAGKVIAAAYNSTETGKAVPVI